MQQGLQEITPVHGGWDWPHFWPSGTRLLVELQGHLPGAAGAWRPGASLSPPGTSLARSEAQGKEPYEVPLRREMPQMP